MGDVTLSPWKGSIRKQGSVYCIEGERVSMEQIAARIGCSKAAASVRLSKLKNTPGAITWAKLRAGGK